MNRKLLYFICFAAIVLGSAACSREDTPGAGSGQEGLYAIISEGLDSKVYMDADRKVYWNAGDKVSVFNGSTAIEEYAFAGQDGDKSGKIEKVAGTAAGTGSPAEGVRAVYPYGEDVTLSGETLSLTLPAQQAFGSGTFAPGASPMAAYSTDNNLSFKNLCGLLIVRLYGPSSISSITLKGNGGEFLAGRAQVTFKDGIPECKMLAEGAAKEITIQCDSPVTTGADESGATEFIFVLPPVSFSRGISISAIDNQGRSYEAGTGGAVEVRRSAISRMAPLRANLSNPVQAEKGSPLPAWKQGYLDIHSINGGRGEAFYYILPDGTTMLVDAAGGNDFEIEGEGGSGIYSRPSRQYSSGNVIVRYIQHFAPWQAGGKIDYFMLSHYHSDHMGSYTKYFSNYGWKVVDRNGTITPAINLNAGGFLLNGLPEVGYYLPIVKLIDRGEWDDRASNVWESAPGRRQNYYNFIDWTTRANGTVREKLAIGHTDQIVLKHNAALYPGFQIRGIAAGGDIWTGSGTSVNTTYLPTAEQCLANIDTYDINENILSCVFTLKYGKFDWFSGGDIQYNGYTTYSWKDIEKPISKVVGKVEAMKANHHSTKSTNSTTLLSVLKPDCYIVGVWTENQPNPATMKRVYTANKNVKIFATNLADSIVSELKAAGIDPATFSATSGHIVLRVLPGGGSYYVYVLDDSDFNYRVKDIYGPFTAS